MEQEQEVEYTVDEYWKLVAIFPNHHYEFVNGFIRELPGRSLVHRQITANIITLLNNVLHYSECNVHNFDVVLQLTDQHNYLPDVAVSCDPIDRSQENVLKAPVLVVEVLSLSTEEIDCTEKLRVYQRYPTIQEILLVDSRQIYVEHHHRISSHKWEVSFYNQEDDAVKLTSINVSVFLRDVYLEVHLELEEAED